MEKKNVFKFMHELNERDTKDGTRLISLCPGLVSANKVKHGCHVVMGAPEQVLMDIMGGKLTPILLLVDNEELEKFNAQP